MPRIELTDMDKALIEAVTDGNKTRAMTLQGLSQDMQRKRQQADAVQREIEERYKHMLVMVGKAHDVEIDPDDVRLEDGVLSWGDDVVELREVPQPEDDVEDAEELRERLSDAVL